MKVQNQKDIVNNYLLSYANRQRSTAAITSNVTDSAVSKSEALNQGGAVATKAAVISESLQALASGLPTIPSSTGDSNVDALLMGNTSFWWKDKQNGAGVTELTYSFLGKTLDSTSSASDREGYKPMTSTQKTAVKAALTYISSIANITFKEVKTSGSGDINFGTNTQSESAGYANLPHASGAHKSYLMLANNQSTNNSFTAGSYGWETLIHELGHTLGLKHPGDYNAGGGGGTPPYLPANLDSRINTVMSYNNPADSAALSYTLKKDKRGNVTGYSWSTSSVNPSTFMSFDIKALQYMYGANTKANPKAQVLTFKSDWQGFETVWAPKAATLDASKVKNANIIDLRDGAASSINIQSESPPAEIAGIQLLVNAYNDASYTGLNNVFTSTGSVLSAAKGGAGKDVIYANNLSKLTIDGGAGSADVLYLQGSQSDWSLSKGVYTNSSTNQKVTVKNIELVRYYDPASTSTQHSMVDLTA